MRQVLYISLIVVITSVDFTTETNNDYESNVSKLIFEFIVNYKRLKFGIVFTCDKRSFMFYDVSMLLMEGNVTFRAINIDDYGAVGDDLEGGSVVDGEVISGGKYGMLMRSLIAHHQFVLLDLECENSDVVLQQASRYELFNASFHWLIIDKKPNIDNTTDITTGTIAAVAASDQKRWTRMYRLRSEHGRRRSVNNCPLAKPGLNVGREDEPGNYYDTGLADGGDVDETFGRFETMNISINAEITLVKATTAMGSASYRTFTLFDVWNPGYLSGGQLNVTAMGNYTVDHRDRSGGKLYVPSHDSTVVRRRDMNGLRLKIMTVVTQKPRKPFEVYLSTPTDTHLDSVHRYNFGLMSYLKSYFNFSFIMRRTKSWGYLRNGTFDGMIGALARREVDLGGSPMFFRQERHRVVSYTTRSFIERPCFIFRHPRRQDTMRNPFLLPFEAIIWYMMVICGAILVLVLFTSFYFEESGLSEIPRLASGKCTSMFILIFGYLMFQYYSASIVGSLLMEPPKNIRTLRDLIDSRLSLGIEDIPYSRDYFVRTTDEDSLELFRTRISFLNAKTGQNESHFSNAADGIQLVKAGGYAFHVAVSAGYKIIRDTFSEREVCELAEIDMFPKSSQWMVAIVQKNSPYRDVITYGLRRLNEAGIMDHQRHVWQEPKPKCVRKMAPTDLIVGMDSVYSAFILLLTGAVVSIGLLLIEILHHQMRLAKNCWPPRRRQHKHQQQQHHQFNVGNLPQQLQLWQKPPPTWDHDMAYPYVD